MKVVRRALFLRLLGAAVLAAVLAAVFGMYTDPEFMRVMADQVWACF